jgi:hypothetical protein
MNQKRLEVLLQLTRYVCIRELRMRTGKNQVCAAAKPELDKPMAFIFDNAGGDSCVSRR